MKKFMTALVCSSLAATISASTVAEEEKSPQGVPAEIYACNYLDGKGPSDLDRVTAGWNKWNDDNDAPPYNAWTLTPFFFGADDYNFDVAWLGAWPNGKVMGAAIDLGVIGDGAKARSKFFDVVSCDTHQSFAVWPTYQVEGGENPDEGVIAFSDCNVKDGKTLMDAGKAMNAWGAKNAEHDVASPSWLFYPGPGSGDIDYDFKAVRGFANYTQYGEYVEYMINGGGLAKMRKHFGDVMECGSSRVYSTKMRRSGWTPGG